MIGTLSTANRDFRRAYTGEYLVDPKRIELVQNPQAKNGIPLHSSERKNMASLAASED